MGHESGDDAASRCFMVDGAIRVAAAALVRGSRIAGPAVSYVCDPRCEKVCVVVICGVRIFRARGIDREGGWRGFE
ncbi:hypothetical protein [Bordetella genomosp. 9]|uniref:hypothetical protein n=1 Tax=Bordetella genomosp. 9 TaxID=1416803 RepID=UPI0012F79199|nr:hypothetical protein [Bordetella genomosp. 9]